MKRSFEGLSPKMHLQKIASLVKTVVERKGVQLPSNRLQKLPTSLPKVAHKLGFGRGCPCNILPTSYVTKVVRQAIAYLEGIK